MLTTRPSFEQIAQIPRKTVYLKPLPYTDLVNSPAYASMVRNQTQIETAAEANLRKQQFDKLLADTAKEYGIRPSDARAAAVQANERGEAPSWWRLFDASGGRRLWRLRQAAVHPLTLPVEHPV